MYLKNSLVMLGSVFLAGIPLLAAAQTASGTANIAGDAKASAAVTPVVATPASNSATGQVVQTAPGVQAVQAQARPAVAPKTSPRVGDATTHLLALQASGQAASRNSHPVTSDVAQRTYQRYLESFTHKIPQETDSMVQGGKSGGGR